MVTPSAGIGQPECRGPLSIGVIHAECATTRLPLRVRGCARWPPGSSVVSLGPKDLLLSSGTIGNPLPAELVRAAQAGGYAGIVLWPGAYLAQEEVVSNLASMRSRIEDAGLVLQDLDAVIVWAGPDDPGAPYYEEAEEQKVYAMADALGARGVNAMLNSLPGLSEDEAIEAFAGICDRAAEHGLAVHLEFSRSRTPCDIKSALRVVEAAGRPNGGLMIDAWHVHWGPGAFEDLRGVDAKRVTGVQLCDAPAAEPKDYGHATRHHRLLPGEGVARIGDLLEILEGIGSQAPLCIEAFHTERVGQIGAVEYAREMADAARAFTSDPRA